MAKYKKALPKLPDRGYFKKGDKGEEVKKMQQAINWANAGRHIVKAALKVDGEVGALTLEAVSFLEEIHHKTIDGEFGNVCLSVIKSMDLNGRIKACNFALAVAKDNRFTYGSGKRAHRSGCYFCQTNTGPRKKNKEKKGEPHYVKDSKGNKHTYARTYCCNTLITAAYAHGAGDEAIYKVCHAGSSCGMDPKDWLKSPHFKKLGTCKAVPFSKLIMGDVILEPSHVWMCLGGGRFVEASGGTWSADSIASKAGARKKYTAAAKKKKSYVMRYTG